MLLRNLTARLAVKNGVPLATTRVDFDHIDQAVTVALVNPAGRGSSVNQADELIETEIVNPRNEPVITRILIGIDVGVVLDDS